jgi:hypothetical protein
MQSEKFQNLKTTGDDATDEDKKKAQRWINDSSILAGILRRCDRHRDRVSPWVTCWHCKRHYHPL